MFMLVYFYVTELRLCTVNSWAVKLLWFEMNVEENVLGTFR